MCSVSPGPESKVKRKNFIMDWKTDACKISDCRHHPCFTFVPGGFRAFLSLTAVVSLPWSLGNRESKKNVDYFLQGDKLEATSKDLLLTGSLRSSRNFFYSRNWKELRVFLCMQIHSDTTDYDIRKQEAEIIYLLVIQLCKRNNCQSFLSTLWMSPTNRPEYDPNCSTMHGHFNWEVLLCMRGFPFHIIETAFIWVLLIFLRASALRVWTVCYTHRLTGSEVII